MSIKRLWLWANDVDDEYPEVLDGHDPQTHQRKVVDSPAQANLISSQLENGNHAPALDLDVPATLIPSSTPGHSHLYIDVEMPWYKYHLLLVVLASCGVLETNHVRASLARRATHLRKPGVKKIDPRA